MTVRRRTTLALVATAALIIPATPAGAATVSDPIVEGLVTPLGLAVSDSGSTLYVSQTFAGLLTAATPPDAEVIASEGPDGAIAGVALGPDGSVIYTVTGGSPAGPIGLVKEIDTNGTVRVLGDTAALELRRNPDRRNRYGFRGLHPECRATVPDGGGNGYKGELNPNAYAVASMPDGSAVVADAGGNSLVRVAKGKARMLAILPPIPVKVTEEIAGAFGFDECVIGSTYNLEPVPTDVELGPDGMLYVSSLAGGAEDPVTAELLGSPGGVFTVDPRTGRVTRYATGFLGAVDLAVAPDGSVYVAELFGNRISKVVDGHPQKVAEVPMPGAVEWANGMLYATGGVFTSGFVVTVDLG